MGRFLMMFAALVLLRCGSDDAATATVTAEAPVVVATPPSVRPAHHGTIVAVGQHPVEVVATNGGEVRAYVRSPHPPTPQHTRMTVHVPDAHGERHPVLLVWDPGAGAYVGRARRVQIAPGAIDVTMVADGQRYTATAPSYVILAAPPGPPVEVVEVEDEGDVVAAPRPTVVVEHPRPTVVVQRPQVVVEHPRPTVVVERPQVVVERPQIVVEHPRPAIVVERPQVVIEHPRPVVVVEPPHPTIVVQRPRPVVVVSPPQPGVVVVEGHGKFKHHGRGHGH
jgi:hypothetical protein